MLRKNFVSNLVNDCSIIYNLFLKREVPMKKLTPAEEVEFADATECGICDKTFIYDDVKVRDHCHLSGKKDLVPHIQYVI